MRSKIITIILLGIFSLVACRPSTRIKTAMKSGIVAEGVADIMTTGSSASPMPTPTARSTVINPLTGLPVDDPALLNRRPVMVKVSNFPRLGRPHAGLSFADIVFDYFIGYGTNRFLALYYGQDSPSIGPVRSGRRVDAQLVTMYGGVLGYGSADNDTDAEIVSRLGDYAISNDEAPCPAFCGESTHDATGVFANSQAISEYVDQQEMKNKKPDLPNMDFSDAPPSNAQPGNQVTILFNFFNRAEWRYDPASGKYLRWIEYMQDEEREEYEMIPLTDRVTGQQLAFSNVILIFAEYTELAPSAHEINIWENDNGEQAYLFRDGLLTQGTWRAENDSDPMKFFDQDGQPYLLKPGNTWIAITGLSSSINETQPGNWELIFFLP